MKWLITTSADADLETIYEQLRSHGCKVNNAQRPIPMENGERVIQCEGPAGLRAELASERGITAVHPSSDMSLY